MHKDMWEKLIKDDLDAALDAAADVAWVADVAAMPAVILAARAVFVEVVGEDV
jgi:hypothetical protein